MRNLYSSILSWPWLWSTPTFVLLSNICLYLWLLEVGSWCVRPALLGACLPWCFLGRSGFLCVRLSPRLLALISYYIQWSLAPVSVFTSGKGCDEHGECFSQEFPRPYEFSLYFSMFLMPFGFLCSILCQSLAFLLLLLSCGQIQGRLYLRSCAVQLLIFSS